MSRIPPLTFGQLIRVQADTPELAASFATDIERLETAERPGMLVHRRVFPDMPNDVFLYTGPHWRKAHEPLNTHGDAFRRTVMGREDCAPKVDEETARAEYVDLNMALYTRQREMIEEAFEKPPGDPDALTVVDMRMDTPAEVPPEVFKIVGPEGIAGTKGAMNKGSQLREYLKEEYGVDPRDVVIFTPAHEPTTTYLLHGNARRLFDDLPRGVDGVDYSEIFGWFIDGVRDRGLLQELDIRDASVREKDE